MRARDIFGHDPLAETAEHAIRFTDDMLGSHHGQSDMKLSAWVGPDRVGYIDYTIFGDEVSMKFIEVTTHKQGYGAALVRELQRRFPDTEIDWGMTTDSGSALLHSLPKREVPNVEVQAKMAQLDDARAREARFASEWKRYEAKPTPENRPAWADSTDEWNDTHDEISRLEDELRGTKAFRRLIVF